MPLLTISELVTGFGDCVDGGEGVLFIGAGLSVGVKYPSWKDLVEPFRIELGIPEMSDLPQLVQFFEGKPGGRQRVEDAIIKGIEKVAPIPTSVHSRLAELPIESIWTTNYDTVIEAAITQHRVFIKDEDLAVPTKDRRPIIYKMHGHIPHSTSPQAASNLPPIVISRDDFDRYPSTHPRFWALLQGQFLTRSFLFLGFGFSDPNLDQILKIARISTGADKRPHFAVMKRPVEIDEQRLHELRCEELSRAGLSVCQIEEYDELSEISHALAARCRPSKLFISGSDPGPHSGSTPDGVYPVGPISNAIESLCRKIGNEFSRKNISVVTAGGLGAIVGYEMCRRLDIEASYSPDRFVLVRRAKNEGMTEPNLRYGSVQFTQESPELLRSEALKNVRAVLVLGGNDGTKSEVQAARAVGLGIIPVGRSGGVASELWSEIGRDFDSFRLGGRRVDRRCFDGLNSEDELDCARSVLVLAAQALSL